MNPILCNATLAGTNSGKEDGDDNIKPITPYNFETTVITDWKQKEVDENSETERQFVNGTLAWALTNKRYSIATVYVDCYSDLSYVYLQQDNSRREILKSKIEFKHYATSKE